MDQIRRDLLKFGVGSTILAALPRPLAAQPLMAHVRGKPEPVPPITDPDVKELALRAVDAARRAGATYADVRLTYSRRRQFGALDNRPTLAPDQEALQVGVRALISGYWGFAGGTLWAKEEMDRLGQQAVALAKANTTGRGREVELAPMPVVRDGHWVTPMKIDPFEVSPFEVVDFLRSLSEFVRNTKVVKGFYFTFGPSYEIRGVEQAFASSEGSYYTQRLQRGLPNMDLWLMQTSPPGPKGHDFIDGFPMATSLGYEIFKEQPVRDYIAQRMDSLLEEAQLPLMSVQVGRFDVVCDARTVGSLVGATLAPATQLDRALGYEANASGTSYLNDPLGMLGTYAAGAPLLNLTGERSSDGGAASVQWDDEGVIPEAFPIIKDGVLVDFQTTRESATWLKARYATHSVPVRSHGCAGGGNAVEPPIQTPPNLRLLPGKEAIGMPDLIANMSDGMVLLGVQPSLPVFAPNGKVLWNEGNITMDFQAMNGFVTADWDSRIIAPPGRLRRVKNGKIVARVGGASIMFRSPELWKGLVALGGEAAVRPTAIRAYKGEPQQEVWHTVTAPPAVFKQLTVVRSI